MRYSRPAVLSAAVLLSACGANVDSGDGSSAALSMSSSSASEKLIIEDAGRIAAGSAHVLSLSTTGVLYAWGDNSSGQLGNNTSGTSAVPVTPVGLTRVQWVSTGGAHSVAVRADGSMWTWGSNNSGQLGHGTYIGARVPTQVTGLKDVVSASAGLHHTIALRRDGSVWGWGWQPQTTTVNSTKPVLVSGLSDVRKIAAGGDFNLALKTDHTVWGWGNNTSGQLGNVSATPSVPVRVLIDQVVTVAAGYRHALALRQDGTVWAWGSNTYGQLGSAGGDTFRPRQVSGLPLPVGGASGVKSLAAGAYNSAVLYSDGSVWVWGFNSGTADSGRVPVRFNGVTDVVSLAIGNGFVSMITANGRVFSTGSNEAGQLGNNTYSFASVPVQVVGLSGVKYLSLGASTGK